MANNRKVQAEIDKLLKKTGEGLDDYEDLFEKFEKAGNPSAKERLEADLKRDIKKLQRQRDQIKAFVASPDVKDTKQLEDYRKRIEEKMAAFKVCEREMKTKAFSKEGLASAAEQELGTPLAQSVAWLRSAIDDGRKLIEILEYEAQRSKTVGRRGKKDQRSDAQMRLDKTQQHFYHWEALLRMLNNEEVEPETVDELYDSVMLVLNEDTSASGMPPMDMYDPFDIPPPKPRAEAADPPAVAEEKSTASPGGKSTSKKTPTSTVSNTPGATAATAAAKPPTASGKSATSSPQAAAAPPSAASVAAMAAAMGSLEAGGLEGDPALLDDTMDGANDDTFGDDAMAEAGAGSLADMASATSKMLGAGEAKPVARLASPMNEPPANTAPINVWEKRKLELQKGVANLKEEKPPQQQQQQQQQQQAPAAAAAPAPAAAPPAAAEAPKAAPASPPGRSHDGHHPSSSAAPSGGADCRYSAPVMLNMLDMSLANLPHILDVDRQRPFEPPNAIDPIEYFPQEVHPILSCRDIYQRFDLETLFFIFYYHQKSFQQYFAAKQLKHHSFRYHMTEKRWYQRREKPKETTEKSERGAYTFFDYEDTWQCKTVEDFTFQYDFLEDELR